MRTTRKLLPLVLAFGLAGMAGGGVPTAGIAFAQDGTGGARAFIKIAGIDGESQDFMHKGEIDVESWSWGETNAGSFGHGGGGGAGKVAMQDFHFTMKYSKASPKLFLACASGQHLDSAVLTLRRGSEPPFEYLIVTMTDVLVTGYQTGGSGGDIPTDQVSLAFRTIQFDYMQQDASGLPGEKTSAGWDLGKNKSI